MSVNVKIVLAVKYCNPIRAISKEHDAFPEPRVRSHTNANWNQAYVDL